MDLDFSSKGVRNEKHKDCDPTLRISVKNKKTSSVISWLNLKN